MWYRYSKNIIKADGIVSRAMLRIAASEDRLWKLLNESGIASQVDADDPDDLRAWLDDDEGNNIQSVGQQVSEIEDEEMRDRLQESFTNYMAGRILGEEIRSARDAAAAEGRDPSVAELRAARHRANERLMEQAAAEGLGLPRQYQLGTRGPLTQEPRLQKITPETQGLIDDDAIRELASGIWRQEVMRTRTDAQRRYDEGLSGTWEPTPSDMRAAVARANEKMQDAGLPFLSFDVGNRGPFPKSGPRLREVVETPQQYWARERHRRRNEELGREREKSQQKRENLGLEPALDIEPETPVVLPSPDVDPTDDYLPEETAIEQREAEQFPSMVNRKRLQMAYQPRPPLHEHCRCTILDLGGGQVWKTAGDDRVCPECEHHSNVFNSLGQG